MPDASVSSRQISALCRVLASLCAVALSGCALRPQPAREDTVKDAMPNVTVPAQWAAAGTSGGAPADNWLASFREPRMDALVAEAIVYNADLRIAVARVDTAAAYLAGAKSPLWPQVNLV